MAKTPIDGDIVRSLAALLDETHLNEIEYEAQGLRIRVARNAAGSSAAPVAVIAPAAAPAQQINQGAEDFTHHAGLVTSPMVGVAYLGPEPAAPRFVKVGDIVSEGQNLALIEAMKTFNPIRAPKSGKVLRILIEDGQPVEFGEPLFILD
jgi:acetyl-CoA carboxylase biotin carboxyl carrier protein